MISSKHSALVQLFPNTQSQSGNQGEWLWAITLPLKKSGYATIKSRQYIIILGACTLYMYDYNKSVRCNSNLYCIVFSLLSYYLKQITVIMKYRI